MQELFLTSFVKDGVDFERASAVLHGLANMSGWHSTQRVLFFAGPLPPRGFPVVRSIPPMAKSQQNALWSSLHQALLKISYIMQLRYEVFRDRDFGGGDGSQGPPVENIDVELNKAAGTLRWTDFPKPTENLPIINRKKIEISDQRNLIAILKDNNHRFKSEAIEESVSYFIDNIELSMVRYYHLPPQQQQQQGADPSRGSQPLASLPPWTTLQPLDPSGNWMLFVRTTVLEDNSPEKVKKAQDELFAMRERLAGVFDFKAIDRRAHDTRIAQPVSNVPAPMPQTQRVRG